MGDPATGTDQPPISGIHHLKFAVRDPEASLKFYEEVFGAVRIKAADHVDAAGRVYAFICDVPGLGTKLDLRLSEQHSSAARAFDPVTLNIADRAALAQWIAHLDRLGAPHSGEIVTALAFMLVIEDPDGRRIRLYTEEKHGPELAGQKDHPWMQL
jgi:catechol 2,3-dioxygenase-like lactoylglutathione lyase family enzyme